MSTGVPGLRVGTGPRGSYIRVGPHGAYYRQTLSQPSGRSRAVPRQPIPQYRQRVSAADEVLMEDVTGATTVELADALPSELINQLNEASRHPSLLLLVILLWLPIATIPLAILLRAKDKARRTVVAFYEVEGSPAAQFQALVDSFASAQQCAAHWHVTAQGAVVTTRQYKVNSGASAILRRDSGRADIAGPPVLASNIAVPSLHSSKRSVYFLPDRIVIRDGREYADMPYQHCRISGTATRFIEVGRIPGDAERVGTTWRYVNKGGGPDRRHKNNPQLPIMQYGQLTLTAQRGFHFIWQTSRVIAASTVATAFLVMSGHTRRDGIVG